MKKTLCILLAILMMFSLFACAEENKEKAENENKEENKYDEEIEYTIYSSGTNAEDNAGGKIPFKNSSELQTRISGDYTIPVSEDQKAHEQTKTITLDGKEYKLDLALSEHSVAVHCENESFKEMYQRIDTYMYYENQTRVMVEYGNNGKVPMFISVLNGSNDQVTEAKITQEEAKTKADELIDRLYGAKAVDGYDVYTSQTEEKILVVYTKYIDGYETYSRVVVFFGLDGKLTGLNAETLGIFDSVEDKITKERIEKAKAVLLDSISKSWTVVSEELVMDIATGVCYLQVSVGNAGDSHQYYINVF